MANETKTEGRKKRDRLGSYFLLKEKNKDWLRQEAFDTKVSMSKIIDKMIETHISQLQ